MTQTRIVGTSGDICIKVLYCNALVVSDSTLKLLDDTIRLADQSVCANVHIVRPKMTRKYRIIKLHTDN